MSEREQFSTGTPGPWKQHHTTIWSPSSRRLVAGMCEPDPAPHREVRYVEPELGTDNWDEIYANARLIAAAPALLEALEQNASINAAMVAWLEDAEPDCSAGNPDGGGPKECDHCIVRGVVQAAQEAIELASAALAAAQPAATSEGAP